MFQTIEPPHNGRLDGSAAAFPAASEIAHAKAFWQRVGRYAPGAQVEHRSACGALMVIVSGWGCEMRVLPDGRRQVFSVMLPGDLVYMQSTGTMASVALVALTRMEVADSTVQRAGEMLAAPNPAVLLDALLLQSARQLDHIVRLGSLSAHERVIHLLLELHTRLTAIGLVKLDGFKIPLTQEMLASILGISVVHINRTLQQLRKRGLITLRSGSVTLHDVERLSAIASYAPPAPANRA